MKAKEQEKILFGVEEISDSQKNEVTGGVVRSDDELFRDLFGGDKFKPSYPILF